MLAVVLPHQVNANFKNQSRALVDKINGIRIDKIEDAIRAFESNTNAQHVIEFLPKGIFECLERQEVNKSNPQILKTYGVPNDRRL